MKVINSSVHCVCMCCMLWCPYCHNYQVFLYIIHLPDAFKTHEINMLVVELSLHIVSEVCLISSLIVSHLSSHIRHVYKKKNQEDPIKNWNLFSKWVPLLPFVSSHLHESSFIVISYHMSYIKSQFIYSCAILHMTHLLSNVSHWRITNQRITTMD